MTDAELKKLARLIADELRSKPLPVITATELKAKQDAEEAARLRTLHLSRAVAASERAQQQMGVR